MNAERQQESPDSPSELRPPRVLSVGALGAVLLWLSQPPAALWPLAWVAPAVWLWLAESPAEWGRREHLRMWLTGALYWLLAVHWVRLPHPLTPLGWAPLALYLGIYPAAVVALVRTARRRWRWPLWIAAPVVWTGLELLQARLFTGFLMGAVSHSQAGQPWVRSIAAYTGAYGVTFAVVMVAATVTGAVRTWRKPERWRYLTGVVAATAVVIAAGLASRATTEPATPEATPPRVALVQGDTRAVWDDDPKRPERIMNQQMALSRQAYLQSEAEGAPLDLVIWPESMFRSPFDTFAGKLTPPDDADETFGDRVANTASWLQMLTDQVGGAAVMVGGDRFDWRTDEEGLPSADVYNTVLLADGEGRIISFYDKTHLVPFGEYIPFASNLPALYYLTPMSGGLGRGAGPVALEVPRRGGGVLRLCPSICYETVVPHVIRRQVATLTAAGGRPDALVNVTNDAWFWGSSELDMHLACDIYRAVENGLPLLVAANGGLSAVIDWRGEVRVLGPRMEEAAMVVDTPPRSRRPTFYSQWGDLFAGACLVACGLLAATRVYRKLTRRKSLSPQQTYGGSWLGSWGSDHAAITADWRGELGCDARSRAKSLTGSGVPAKL